MNDSTSSLTESSLPVVVIAGRSNVGKSTLFNRLVGTRKAITDEMPGVTRDPVEGYWNLDDGRVLLVDTGGFRLEGQNLDRLVSRRSMERTDRADVILLMLDVLETTPEDETFIETLRSYGDRVVLVINKVDNDKRLQDVWNFYSYGFSKVVGISAAHGLGIDELSDTVSELLPDGFETFRRTEKKHEETPGIAILGKPNTGKSTLLNTLLGTDKALVTDIPGTTRDVIEGFFSRQGQSFRVLDTAGIRRKNKVNEAVEYYSVNRAIKSIESADIVYLVIDVLEGISDQDKKIAQLAVKHGKGIIIVLNKWDMVDDIPNRKNAEMDRIRFLFPVLHFAPIVFLSAKTGLGIDVLISTTRKVWRQLHRTVDTPSLNKLLAEAAELRRPTGKRRYRAKYITQTGSNPLRFVLFVNVKKGFPRSWVGFIMNRIRKDFAVPDVPILMELRE